MPKHKPDLGKVELKGNRKKDLNRVRGLQKVIDPERGRSGEGRPLPD
ncbi:MAG TPA: hypothetical protein PK728_06650 [Bacillota bacterium]|nr:hypothetical protein [Bacillota bacterium]